MPLIPLPKARPLLKRLGRQADAALGRSDGFWTTFSALDGLRPSDGASVNGVCFLSVGRIAFCSPPRATGGFPKSMMLVRRRDLAYAIEDVTPALESDYCPSNVDRLCNEDQLIARFHRNGNHISPFFEAEDEDTGELQFCCGDSFKHHPGIVPLVHGRCAHAGCDRVIEGAKVSHLDQHDIRDCELLCHQCTSHDAMSAGFRERTDLVACPGCSKTSRVLPKQKPSVALIHDNPSLSHPDRLDSDGTFAPCDPFVGFDAKGEPFHLDHYGRVDGRSSLPTRDTRVARWTLPRRAIGPSRLGKLAPVLQARSHAAESRREAARPKSGLLRVLHRGLRTRHNHGKVVHQD